MRRLLGMIPLVLKQITRSPVRSGLTISGIAVAMFLFTSVEGMRAGVANATTEQAEDATLIVYRENRFCPFSSRLPEYYEDRIARLEGVRDVVPMQIHVSNCRASLDVVTFRGVPEDDFASILGDHSRVTEGSLADWKRRSDSALVGQSLAARRGVKVGDRFSAAGVTVYVAGILSSEQPQDRNVAYVHLPFLQETLKRGGTGGIVTQFNVRVNDPTHMEDVAATIDEEFRYDEHPTTTRSEKAFVGRAARDIVELVDFAGWIGWGSLAAVLALVANAIVLSMRDRIRDHAVLRTLGWTGPLIAWMVLLEGATLGLIGGMVGAIAAAALIHFGHFSMTMEGLNVEIISNPLLAVIGTGIAVALGLVAGAVPAWRAGRTEIAQGFRAV
ncbi:MAG: ABC transporter permease [Phycisphaerales bacterium]|nr:ABC transporter permease [Phycisphaerales bacterium]